MKRRNSPDEAAARSKKARFTSSKPTVHSIPSTSKKGAGNESDDDFDIDYLNDGSARKKEKRKLREAGSESSSDEEEDEETKKGEDVDMFGGDDGGEGMKTKKKDDRFLDKGLDIESGGDNKDFLELGDIKGQEFGNGDKKKNAYGSDDEEARSGSEVSEEEYLSEDDRANDDDAPRTSRSKTGMGFSLTGFNMSEEMREGRFSADGSYVRNAKDQGEKHDVWLDGVNSKAEIKAARAAKKAREQKERERIATEGAALDRDDCLKGVLELVGPRETVTQALSRIGKLQKKRSSSKNLKEDRTTDDSEATKAAEQLARLATLSSTLLSAHNEVTIFEMTGLEILQTLKDEGAVRRDWLPSNPAFSGSGASDAIDSSITSSSLISRPTGNLTDLSEVKDIAYRFLNDSSKTVQGPFSRTEMINWAGMGYFGSQGENVEISRDGGNSWSGWNL
ncbi:hypothetical protein BT69DRAFT_1336152 [Atractiella rhizophila]|nr:hypothetical protein BT69DRAFT_1336152 [Atractiella rhizophila]